MRLLLLSFLLFLSNFNVFSQKLEILPEHEFYQILAGAHPQQDSFEVWIQKFDSNGNSLDSVKEIAINNKVIIPEDIYFLPEFNESGEPQNTNSVYEYLLAFDSIIDLKNGKISQNKSVKINNSVFYNLKLEQFNFSDFEIRNCDFREGFQISNSDFTSFTCDISFNYIVKNNVVNQVTPYYMFNQCNMGKFYFSPISLGDIDFIKSKAAPFEVYANIRPFDERYNFPKNEPINVRIDSSIITESFVCFASNAINNFSLIPESLPANIFIRNTNISQTFKTQLNTFSDRTYLRIGLSPKSNLDISGSLISATNKKLPLYLIGNIKNINVDNSIFEVPVCYNNQQILEGIQFNRVLLNGISLYKTQLPNNVYNVNTNWLVLAENLQLIFPGTWKVNSAGNVDTTQLLPYIFNPIQNNNLDSVDLYYELTPIYQNFINIYKNRGSRIMADQAYVEMRTIETQRVKHDYEQRKKLSKLFQLRFNQLLSFASDYGTNPLLVLFNALFVIVFFGFVFLLVPNQIDTSGAKPLGKVLLQVWFSFDQSLRAFLTFGKSDNEFPFARFIALIEGLMGWFLLVLFVVSLIYQALI